MKKLSHQLGWFVLVGVTAAIVHWLVVVALVSRADWAPLVANVVGWLVAFGVSFTGHYQLTFRAQQTALSTSLPRFFLLSAVGFLINETSYAILLQYTDLPYELLLGLILIGVAVLTFILSRIWAFTARH
jgi:putative flippase GtrA